MILPAITALAEGGHDIPVVDPSAAGSLALPLVLVIALPAFGAAFLLLGGRRTDAWGHLVGCAAVVGSFICSTWLFIAILGRGAEDRQISLTLWTWFSAGDWTVELGLLYDPLSALFLLLITGVGGLIHIYSIGYMAHDERRRRFFAYLNLFVASMLVLVLDLGLERLQSGLGLGQAGDQAGLLRRRCAHEAVHGVGLVAASTDGRQARGLGRLAQWLGRRRARRLRRRQDPCLGCRLVR